MTDNKLVQLVVHSNLISFLVRDAILDTVLPKPLWSTRIFSVALQYTLSSLSVIHEVVTSGVHKAFR